MPEKGPDTFVPFKLYALMVRGHHQLGQRQEAWDVCREGLTHYPDSVELLFLQACLLREQGKYLEAEAGLNRLLRMQPEKSFVIVDPALRGFKARYELGLVYAAQHRTWEAEAQWRAVVDEQPRFTPAWQELGRIYLSGQRWAELEDAARAVEQFAADPAEASVLRARGQLARNEYPAARLLLEEVIARDPQALKPRVILSHVLLQENRDRGAAEKALREVLSLDPSHAEARHNLAVLQQQALG